MTLADTALGDLTYAEVVIGVIIAWVLVALWQRVFENTAYTACGLDPKSAFHALLVAIVVTVIFFLLIYSVNSLARGFLIGDTTAAPAAIGDNPPSTSGSNSSGGRTGSSGGARKQVPKSSNYTKGAIFNRKIYGGRRR